MAILNPFQLYSQGENTVTNNVLLMLSNLYEINPKYYEEYIKALSEDSDQYEVVPAFKQQVGRRDSGIVDGYIQMKASKIIIETKLHGLEWINKLVKYSHMFVSGEYKLLIHLSSEKYTVSVIKEIENRLGEIKDLGKVNFISITYQDLVDQLKELAGSYQYEQYLQKLYEHFESYCLKMGLMLKYKYYLRALASGQSYELNIKHQFYFDLASRGYRYFKFLGIYKEKSIRYIGHVENIIEADWDETAGLNVKDSSTQVTEVQRQKLIEAIIDSVNKGWAVDKDHRFFLLNNFTETDFRKTSPGGIFRVRYFNLEEKLGKVPDDIVDIAEQLKTQTWE